MERDGGRPGPEATGDPSPPSGGRGSLALRLLGAFLLAGLAALSARLYRQDAEERASLELLARRFTLDKRHPASVRTLPVAPSADLALAALVTATLDDALSPRALRGLSPSERRLWLEAATRLDEQMAEMEKRLARAAAGRPGWPYHRILRGQLALVRARRRGELGSPDAWWPPLQLGASAAPGDDGPAIFLSAAALDSWDQLSEPRRVEAKEALRRAFRDSGFLNAAVALAQARIGREETLSLLPDTAAALKAAFRAAAGGDLVLAEALHRRWEARERVERSRDLEAIEERSRRGDAAGARRLCASFVATHPLQQLDDPLSRRQLARVLALWPGGHSGSFASDPRAALVRHLLDGRTETEGLDGRSMVRALDDLPDAPDSTRAAGWVLAGNAYELERLARRNEASETLEWAPVWLLAARRRLQSRDLPGATEAMARVARPALSGCDGLLTRRELAEAMGDADEAASLTTALQALDVEPVPGGPEVRLALCVDPRAPEQALRLSIGGGPALLVWGFDGALSSLQAIGVEAELLVPLKGLRGGRILRLQAEAGGSVQVREAARIEPEDSRAGAGGV